MAEKKYSLLDDYSIVKTLGSGLNSKVKKAFNNKDNKYYAVKLVKGDNVARDEASLRNEFEILKELDHPNIIKIVDFQTQGSYTKKSGKKKDLMYTVLELAQGGELFDYVKNGGRFSEEVARFYFRQLIGALEYCHSKGFVHRDLKPENLLFDSKFNLKIADFGFSTNMNRTLSTTLGTPSYQAPEIHLKMPYSGTAIDLFSAGIILFIMAAGSFPFYRAEPKDDFYKFICQNRSDQFWKNHKDSQLSDSLKDLLNAMLAFTPIQRLSLPEIKNHPWFNLPVPDLEKDIFPAFLKRREVVLQKIQEDILKKIKEKEKQDKKQQHGSLYGGFRKFRSNLSSNNQQEAEANEGDLMTLEQKFPSLKKKRELQQIQLDDISSALTIFTFLNEQVLLTNLLEYTVNNFNEVSLNENKYRIDCKHIGRHITHEFSIKFFKYDQATFCIEFIKISGELYDHHEVVTEINKYVQSLEKFYSE